MSDEKTEKNSNVVRISDEAYAAVKREAKDKEVSVGQAATLLLMRGDNRKRALNKYNKRVAAGEVMPLSRKEANKTRSAVTKTKAQAARKEAVKAAEKKGKGKKAAKKAKPTAPEAVLNGASTQPTAFTLEEA